MQHVFEEIVSRALGRLYSAALFMCGGAVARAENAIIEAIGRAASEYPGPFLEDVTGWLEERVVLHCLEAEEQRWSPSSQAARSTAAAGRDPSLRTVAADVLYGAAAELPPSVRAALWWVMFSRRRYADVATLLGVSRDELLDLLAYRDAFLAAVRRKGGGSRDVALPGS